MVADGGYGGYNRDDEPLEESVRTALAISARMLEFQLNEFRKGTERHLARLDENVDKLMVKMTDGINEKLSLLEYRMNQREKRDTGVSRWVGNVVQAVVIAGLIALVSMVISMQNKVEHLERGGMVAPSNAPQGQQGQQGQQGKKEVMPLYNRLR